MRHALRSSNVPYRLAPYAAVTFMLWLGACNIGGNVQDGVNDGAQRKTSAPPTLATTQSVDANAVVAPELKYALLQTDVRRTECVTLGADGNVVLLHCQAAQNQFWNLDHNHMRNMSGLCLSVLPTSSPNTPPLMQAVTCNMLDVNQTFTLDNNTLVGGSGYCLDLAAASTTDGTSVLMQDCNKSNVASQQFIWGVATPSAASTDPNFTHGSGKYTTLVWADEFNGTALDSNVWGFEVNCDGGGNNEAECYTSNPNNLFLDRQGHLVMQILKASGLSNGKSYSSARITTQHRQDFLYGRLEARLQIPVGSGMWPAFWTMPTDSVYGVWPTSGELDIMENVGRNPTTLYGTAHFGLPNPYTQLGGTLDDPNMTTGFHTYALERDANQVRWYYDDKLYFTANSTDTSFWPSGYTPSDATPWPFEQNFYVIFNVAIGGDFGGGIDSSIVGDAMVVDWVRIYHE